MADEQLKAPTQNTLANTPEIFVTAPAGQEGVLITSVVASNNTGIAANYTAYIVSSGDTATLPQVPSRTIKPKKADIPAELAGQVIPPGGTLQFSSTAASSIIFVITGRQLT